VAVANGTLSLGADSLPAGVIAANAVKDSIANEFHLSNAQYFLLPSIFMVGLLVASPVFAQLTRTTSALSLIGTLHSNPLTLHAAAIFIPQSCCVPHRSHDND
jgi:hypothetical protein